MSGFICSLCCRVVELVLPRPCEAALDAAVPPQPPDHVGQVFGQDSLLLCSCRQGEQLLGVILRGQRRHVTVGGLPEQRGCRCSPPLVVLIERNPDQRCGLEFPSGHHKSWGWSDLWPLTSNLGNELTQQHLLAGYWSHRVSIDTFLNKRNALFPLYESLISSE